MTDNYIFTKEFYEEHPMHQEVINQLNAFIDYEVEFTIQGDEYTVLVQFVARLKKIHSSQSHIESGHLVADNFFIYLENDQHIKFTIPAHQVCAIHHYSDHNVEFDCNLYRIKLRILDACT